MYIYEIFTKDINSSIAKCFSTLMWDNSYLSSFLKNVPYTDTLCFFRIKWIILILEFTIFFSMVVYYIKAILCCDYSFQAV